MLILRAYIDHLDGLADLVIGTKAVTKVVYAAQAHRLDIGLALGIIADSAPRGILPQRELQRGEDRRVMSAHGHILVQHLEGRHAAGIREDFIAIIATL